jgi:DNA-binding Xre family transcriptional regulator
MRAANTLVLIMKNRRVSGRELSEITGISRSAVSQIVNGRLLPTDDELEKICRALQVTPEQIYPIPQMRQLLQMTLEDEGDVLRSLGILRLGGERQIEGREPSTDVDETDASSTDASEPSMGDA